MQSFLDGKSDNTVKAYQKDLNSFAAFCGEEDANKAGAALIQLPHGKANLAALEYRNFMLAQNLSSATVNRRLAALRSVCSLARRFGMIQWELSVDGVKHEKRKDMRGPTVDDFDKIVAYTRTQVNDVKRLRDLAMLALFFSDGLRRNELLTADLEDLNIEAGTIRVVGKGKKEKVELPIPAGCIDALKRWIEIRGDQPGPIFVNLKGVRISGRGVYHIINTLGKHCGVVVRPHGLRHTCFTAGADAGIPLHELKELSRHADIRTLEGYLDKKDDTARNVANKISDGRIF